MASEKSSKYEAVYNELLKSIQNGDFLPGEKLLAESDLAAKFNVSRNTLRQAITLLVQDGYLSN
ncbi:MAG: winged helix-turn-helix transcriptional regulator, partial [Spirochaetales bacterium]|nr:winged helix-turn-helix transcriptional regulator [Spirochaetales bacterium]